ncbi:ATP-binding protein [Streptomyces roseiscleroticus]|uniref:histidine kinase n=1 Tax=Streptomyces roseiscleroticus TaxID=1972 RepID=A0ABN3F2U3_9ACTN
MSHLRAPATRADRREGGRHGRPVARSAPSLTETAIRPQLLRLAVLPPVAVALSACAAVLFTVRSTGAPPGPTLWAVLAGALGVALAGIVTAAVTADRTARSVRARLCVLRRSSARGEADLRALVEALRRGESPPARTPRTEPPARADEFDLLAADLAQAHEAAVGAVVRAAQLSSRTGSEQKVEVFVNLARRLQSLVHREISILDELEHEIEDPDLLKGLFHVDHLATRIRRHAENLAVLGGAVSRRQWSHPVSMTEVLRSATAEVEQYSRVKLVPPVDGTVRGHAVSDVIHLLAELVENATVFSAPHTQVLLRASLVTAGLAVEVEDRGLGMPAGEQSRMNALLADPDQVNVASLLQDGRIGLFVVSQLARRHGIHVRLQSNIYGGVQAVLVVPEALLGTDPAGPADEPRERLQPAQGTRRPPRWSATPEPAGASPEAAGSVPRQPQGSASPAPHRQPSATGGRPAAVIGGPAPLLVRDARRERPNPADAPPGIRPGDRPALLENNGVPPTPRAGTARGTADRPPRLPRRRAQQHLVPQLRGGPAPAPRQNGDRYVAHDPGLMAAFRRGIGLAAEAHRAEPDRPGEAAPGTAATTPGPSDAHRDAPRTGTASAGPGPLPPAVPPPPAAARPGGPGPHTTPGPRETNGAHRPPPGPGPAPRHDGSAPAG